MLSFLHPLGRSSGGDTRRMCETTQEREIRPVKRPSSSPKETPQDPIQALLFNQRPLDSPVRLLPACSYLCFRPGREPP